MAKVTVSQFAEEIKTSVEDLCRRLKEAGIEGKKADDLISEEEKASLLAFLRRTHGKEAVVEPKKIVLKRKTVSELKVPIAGQGRMKARSMMVNVEVRTRRTYAKRGMLAESMRKEQEQAAAKAQAEREAAEQHAAEKMIEAKASEAKASAAEKEKEIPAEVVKKDQPTVESPPVQQSPITEEKPGEAVVSKDAVSKDAVPKDDKNEKKKHKREELHVASTKSGRRKKRPSSRRVVVPEIAKQHRFERPTAPIVREVELPENITVGELAQRMSVKAPEVIKVMMGLGSMVTINQIIDQDTAMVVVEEMGHKPKLLKENAIEEDIILSSRSQGDQVSRAPVVTIMGHVDHGKTSLLDYIRRSRVVAGEAGGITQHIGAYQVTTSNGVITFLDTPGHEAFTAMRARGAKVTDIVVIVVAADDGVMPQTEEAIKHATAGSVPIIIAINKVDKEDADTERVKQQLSQHSVIPEDWGGDTICVMISVKTGQGIEDLLEAILLQTELIELKASAKGPAMGVVLESRLDKGRGPIASVLVQSGELEKGDIMLSGYEFGRVRAMLDDNGKEINKAGPSTPVEVLGLSGVPNAGDDIIVVENEKKAREIALFRQGKHRETRIAKQQTANLDILSRMDDRTKTSLNLLIKADAQGTAEAVSSTLSRLSNDDIKINITSSGVGGITESDINLAVTSKSMVIGFNVRADAAARKLVSTEGVDLRYYDVIYDVIQDIKKVGSGLLEPEIREQIIGNAEVRDVFRSPKMGDIAGCIVTSGMVRRNSPIRVLRDNVVIYEGELESLRRFKDDVNEVKSGVECGIAVKNYNDVRVADQIEVFERIEVERAI